jgi:hypothetical protein
VCCIVDGGAASCVDTGTCAGSAAQCDETADCSGSACCISAVLSNGYESYCGTGLTGCSTQPHMCRFNSECPSYDCTPWRCGVETVETCGASGSDAGCIP